MEPQTVNPQPDQVPTSQPSTPPLQNPPAAPPPSPDSHQLEPDKKQKNFPIIILSIGLVSVLGIASFFGYQYFKAQSTSPASTYEECTQIKGSIIQESYPETCITPNGQHFTHDISSEMKPTPLVTTTPLDPQVNQAIAISNSYIISKVGDQYFQQNYKLLPEKSRICNKENQSYCIQYEYLPASELSQKQQILQSKITNGKIDHFNGVHDCLNQPQLCQFTTTKNEAIELAVSKGFDPSQLSIVLLPFSVENFESWYWHINQSVDNTPGESNDCGFTKTMSIDTISKKTSQIETNEWCI